MKTPVFRLAMAQLNPTVGDLAGNAEKIVAAAGRAKAAGCHFIAVPELCLTGYPPEDLLLRAQFIHDQETGLRQLAKRVPGLVCVVGFIDQVQDRLYNAAAVLSQGKIIAIYHKVHLPNYSVFDEERYFCSGDQPLILEIDGWRIGLSICEDIWIPESVVEAEALTGRADLLLNISASPYCTGKGEERLALMSQRARRTGSAVVYVNLVGGQDELVFDGRSLAVSPDGRVLAAAQPFVEDLRIIDFTPQDRQMFRNEKRMLRGRYVNPLRKIKTVKIDRKLQPHKSPVSQTVNFLLIDADQLLAQTGPDIEKGRPLPFPLPPGEGKGEADQPATTADGDQGLRIKSNRFDALAAEVYAALLLGLKDYTGKNGFRQVVLGLSGGIDSALVAALAADALGAGNVITVAMPSQYSSTGSLTDARRLAANLSLRLLEIPIRPLYEAYLSTLQPSFANLPADITEENLQARIRGNLLMALSNKFGWLVLATGNKSEVSVGYCTIYGDMAGGFSPLKDVYKTMVYRLCYHRNRVAGYDLIPQAIIDKAPSAELKPDQTDQDSLPPYELLDAILERYVEEERGVEEIAALGYEREMVQKVARLVDWSEYKRRQAAPGIKITPRAFGKDRRMPITNHSSA